MILIGDSQALVVAPAVRQAMPAELDGALYFRAYPSCSTVIGGGNPDDEGCLKFNTTYISRYVLRINSPEFQLSSSMHGKEFSSPQKRPSTTTTTEGAVLFLFHFQEPNIMTSRDRYNLPHRAEASCGSSFAPFPIGTMMLLRDCATVNAATGRAPDITQTRRRSPARVTADAVMLMEDFQATSCKVTIPCDPSFVSLPRTALWSAGSVRWGIPSITTGAI